MAKQKSDQANSYLSNILTTIDNEFASIVDEGIIGDNEGEFIDTGSYILNAQISGSLFGGIPENKVTAFAGEAGVGKTYYAIECIKSFQVKYPTGVVLYFESESAITRQMLFDRGVDITRVAIVPVETIQQFRTEALKALDVYQKDPNPNKPKMMFVLDSLGNLSTNKEVEDIASGSDKRDMTRAQLVRGAFRVLTLKMGKLSVPMILTNHTYEVVGAYVPTKKMGGGGGVTYAASTICFLSKAKDREGTDVVGSIITSHLQKGRMTKEQTKVKTLLNFAKGLDKYYGLIELACKYGVFQKLSKQIQLPDGKKVFEKTINREPEKYFTEEVLKMIDEYSAQEFLYGSAFDSGEEEVIEEEVE